MPKDHFLIQKATKHGTISAREKAKTRKNLALGENKNMYKNKSPQITLFERPENFMMHTGLDPNNRWVKMSKLIPWELVEAKYAKNFKETPFSRPVKPARMAIGTLISGYISFTDKFRNHLISAFC